MYVLLCVCMHVCAGPGERAGRAGSGIAMTLLIPVQGTEMYGIAASAPGGGSASPALASYLNLQVWGWKVDGDTTLAPGTLVDFFPHVNR